MKIKISKETAVPAIASVEPNTIYLVSVGADKVEIYISNNAGDALRRILNEADIQTLIDTAMAGISAIEVVSDIAARDALVWTGNGKVYVEDASGDSTVDAGGAEYVYKHSTQTYIKASEAESLDLIIQWASIQGGPTSTPAQIDVAVTNSHSHANKTELDLIGQDADGDITYAGTKIANQYTTTAW